MVSQAACAVTTFLFNRIMMKLLGEDGVAAITIIIYCVPAYPAGIYGSGGCVAGSADSRADYNGGGAVLSLS